MKRVSGCPRRPEASLLAAGALDPAQKEDIERHLAACADCRSYYSEIAVLSASFANWEKELSPIEATPAAQNRWRDVVRTSAPPPKSEALIATFWRELILPNRFIWSSLAAIWIAMFFINWQLARNQTPSLSSEAGAPSQREISEALEFENRVLAELTEPIFTVPAPSPPAVPAPRSQKRRDWAAA
jgi:anti-sigma factor RsiW